MDEARKKELLNKFLNPVSVDPKEIISKKEIIKTGKQVAGLYGLFYAGKMGLNALKYATSKAERECGATNDSPAKKGCLARAKIKIYTSHYRYLEGQKSKCKNEECLNKIMNEIKKSKVEVILAKRDLKEYEKELEKAKEEVKRGKGEVRDFKAREKADKELQEGAGEVVAGLGGFIVSGILWQMMDSGMTSAWKYASLLWSEAARKCKNYDSGPLRDMCIARYRLQALTKKRDILESAMTKCNARGDKEKCELKILPKIKELEAQITMYQENIRLYQQGAIEAAKEQTLAAK